ncbi:MAG TPA: MOSC domain-containing protein [Verrucomicrobiae bacterium]
MDAAISQGIVGCVASLHLHPVEPGTPLFRVEFMELVEGKGIVGDNRYFGKLSRDTGAPSRRQVSLIEREQLAEHATGLGMAIPIAPGAVRSNIETSGVSLIQLLDKEIELGTAVLYLHSQRDPCAKMDALCQGLRERMMNGRQGVLAEVRRSGKVRVGDPIRVRP